MKFLQNKIPPPVVLLVTLLLIWRLDKIDDLLMLPAWFSSGGAILLLVLGFGIAISASVSFRRAQTTINPLKPETASQLVTSGVFRISRNPMYVGMVAVALAAALYASSVYSLVLVIGLLLWLDRLQIAPEELAMQKLFGDEFTAYKQQVRRWL